MSGQHGLLELLLPDGRSRRSEVIGSSCPERLRPPGAEPGDGPVDLMVLAPGESEAGDADWPARVAARCCERLTADGLIYLLAAPAARRRARAALTRSGFVAGPAFVHLPDAPESRHMVGLERDAARRALRSVVPVARRKRWALDLALHSGAGRMLEARLGTAGLVFQRDGARPPLTWFTEWSGNAAGATVSASWRPTGPRVVVQSGRALAKVALDGEALDGAEGEGVRLRRLGPAAREAGARIPEPLSEGMLGVSPLLVETRLAGDVLAPSLAGRHRAADDALNVVCAWLERWQGLTATTATLDRELLEREVLAPAREIAPRLRGGEAYLAALRRRCDALEGRSAPLTASHNDLTMWNVLVGAGEEPAIVDWESAVESGLPLRDLPYAIADAVAGVDRYRDRAGAARLCFEPGGSRAAAVAELRSSASGAIGAPEAVVELSFHACWLGHAVNESRRARDGTGPFGEILQWLADRETGGR